MSDIEDKKQSGIGEVADSGIVTRAIKLEEPVLDVEARKKLIEEFSSKEVLIKEEEIPQLEPKLDRETEWPGVKNSEAYIPPPTRQRADPRRAYVLLALICIAGLFFVWDGYLEDKIFNANSIINRPVESVRFKSLEEPKHNVSSPVVLRTRLSNSEYGVSSRIKRMQEARKVRESKVLAAVAPADVSEKSNVKSGISTVWKIKSVEGQGQKVIVSMVDSDREVEISTGASLIEVGKITSIRRTAGKWYVVGSNKVISE
jgi:hypothetical protein